MPVELPEDGVLAGREQPLVIIDIDQHPLEDDVQVEGLARHVLEVPGDLPRARVQGQRRVGVEDVVVGQHPAARRHPRLRLRGADEEEVEVRIVGARNPGVAAAQVRRDVAPGPRC